MAKNHIKFLIILLSLCLSGCGIATSLIIAKSANPKISINERYIKSSNKLGNGIEIETIKVLSSDTNGIPLKYKTIGIIECFNPGSGENKDYWPGKLYFNKPNKHYLWSYDSVSFVYETIGKNRKLIQEESEKSIVRLSDKSNVLPYRFSSNSWYVVNTFDPTIERIFLYVDNKMKFEVTKFLNLKSPI